jgi:hypothetical protein
MNSPVPPRAALLFLAVACAPGLVAQSDLSRFSKPGVGIFHPMPAEPVETSLKESNGRFVFTCKDDHETVRYTFDPAAGPFEGISLGMDDREISKQPFRSKILLAPAAPPRIESSTVLQSADETAAPGAAVVASLDEKHPASTELVRAALSGNTVEATYRLAGTGLKDPVLLDVTYATVGKSLEVRISADKPLLKSIQVEPTGDVVPAEYDIGTAARRLPSGAYLSAAPDPWQSDASILAGDGSAIYEPLSDGRRWPAKDTFYLTASSQYPEVLFNSPFPASPYIDELATRVVMDFWEGTFAGERAYLEELATYGLDHLFVIYHIWQNKGFDRSNPNMMPANTGLGGNEGLLELAQTARKLGHRFALHENYFDIVPKAPGFHEDLLLRNPDGTFLPRSAGGMFFVKPSRFLDLVREYSLPTGKTFGLNATYHDVVPNQKVDYEASATLPGKLRNSLAVQRDYFSLMRQANDGPVVSEMLYSPMAGAWDGGCNAFTNNRDDRKLLPLVELLKVHPKIANQGVGYYERWLPWGFQQGWQSYVMTDRELDRYRAMAVAFGRMGFIGRQLVTQRALHATIREYYLMQAYGRAYTGRPLKKLEYQTLGGDWIDGPTAAMTGQWQRLRVEYEGGQKVWVNYSPDPWEVDGLSLPGWSSATRGPRAIADTSLRDGQITDYAEYGDTIFADARSHTFLPSQGPPPIRPKLAGWTSRDDGSADIEILWNPERTLPVSFRSVWHFREVDSKTSRPVFGDVHPIASKDPVDWQPGDSVSDKRRIRIPEKDARTGGPNSVLSYDLVVCLTDPTGGNSRPELVDRLNMMRIARITVSPGDHRIVSVEPESQPPPPGLDPAAYREGANTEKKLIDFGKVATNGAVIVRKTGDQTIIIPVPAGQEMTVGLPLQGEAVPVRKDGTRDAPLPFKNSGGKTFFEIPSDAARVEIQATKNAGR